MKSGTCTILVMWGVIGVELYLLWFYIFAHWQIRQSNGVAGTGSMLPTLDGGDFTFAVPPVNLTRGDIITFTVPALFDNPNQTVIKRLIGLPGDVVELSWNGQLTINYVDVSQEEVVPFDPKNIVGNHYDWMDQPTIRQFRETLPEGRSYHILRTTSETDRWYCKAGPDCYLVLGDNRDHSGDSRHFWCVRSANIRSRAERISWSSTTRGDDPSAGYWLKNPWTARWDRINRSL